MKEYVHTPVPVDTATTTWSIQHMCTRSVCVDDLSQPTQMFKTTSFYRSYSVVTAKLSDNITLKHAILLYEIGYATTLFSCIQLPVSMACDKINALLHDSRYTRHCYVYGIIIATKT